MTTRRHLLSLSAFALGSLVPSSAHAGEVINAQPGGVAVKGYDVVAYFTVGRPVEGDPRYTHQWRGVRWQFANVAHLDAFASEPARYAPRYGGFCAGGMARGRRAPIDPEAFVIHDGKLYLHFNHASAETMRADPEVMVERADENWVRLRRTE